MALYILFFFLLLFEFQFMVPSYSQIQELSTGVAHGSWWILCNMKQSILLLNLCMCKFRYNVSQVWSQLNEFSPELLLQTPQMLGAELSDPLILLCFFFLLGTYLFLKHYAIYLFTMFIFVVRLSLLDYKSLKCRDPGLCSTMSLKHIEQWPTLKKTFFS